MPLTKKDRRALMIGLAVLFIFLLVQFVFFPLLDKRDRLEHGIQKRQKTLVELQKMQDSYNQLSLQNNSLERQLARRSEDFSLFSFLEKMAAATEVKENIVYMKPSDAVGEGSLLQVMVEMKLKSVSLVQLVAFLERIESPDKLVELKRISIQENKKQKGTLDVIMQVISLVRSEG